MMERTCKKCGETKPIEDFKKNKACKYGYTYKCHDCIMKEQSEFRIKNRDYVNNQAANYRYKKNPEILISKNLRLTGFKKCSKCGSIYPFKEFTKDRAICYKCRTGHERGIFINKTDDGRFLKILSEEEKKINRNKNAKKWDKANPEKRKVINKRSYAKRKANGKLAEQARKYYILHPKSESRLRYQKSIKGFIASRKAKITWVKQS